jgi:hypothetical protein
VRKSLISFFALVALLALATATVANAQAPPDSARVDSSRTRLNDVVIRAALPRPGRTLRFGLEIG